MKLPLAGTRRSRRFWRYLPLYIMMTPGILYLLINNYLPMIGLIIAFKDINYVKGFFASDWIGFRNFEYLFKQSAYIITRNTVLYNVVFIIINTTAALVIAIFLKDIKQKILSRFYQSVILFPNLISMVIVSYLVMAFLNTESGLLNKVLMHLFGIEEISWYSSPQYWPVILTLVNMWKNVGLFCIIYLAAIISVDHQYYEAAVLDGAGKWAQVRHITLPLISPVIIMMVLLAIGKIFYSDFGLFYLVPINSSILYEVTTTIDIYVFRALIRLGDIGMASAAGFYQSIVGFALVLSSNLVIRKLDKDSALF